jgi:regulator-associated protein of mTOR
MLGQLNWVFTAITDTIAWNVLESALFHRLFRNDLLIAAMFRNFLLAVRGKTRASLFGILLI